MGICFARVNQEYDPSTPILQISRQPSMPVHSIPSVYPSMSMSCNSTTSMVQHNFGAFPCLLSEHIIGSPPAWSVCTTPRTRCSFFGNHDT
eukprot:scaffold17404_cov35-Attheya_sp.AAC.2